MKKSLNLSKILMIILVFFITRCSSFNQLNSNDTLKKESSLIVRICFWNVKNLSINGLQRENKGNYILDFSKTCDIIAFLEIRSANVNMASEFESALDKAGESFVCEEGESKSLPGKSRKEKYVTCSKTRISDSISTFEFPDEEVDFARPPTFFFIEMVGKKILIIPFHSTPGEKGEIEKFQKVVDLAYKNYSDRRIFFGGDFNTGSNYQKKEFLYSIPYFIYLNQLISEPTTFADQHHDLIFTDKLSGKECKGKVWRLDELFPDLGDRKNLEKVSDHFPVSAECKFLN
ncbi:MAG: hypothetical protein KDK36_03495 [Leptospiraceae bacterium]|nr:hypothetical protein [Leptospiraceae bacterium]